MKRCAKGSGGPKKRPKFANNLPKSEKCSECGQLARNIVLYNGHLNKSCEEFIALTDEKLSLFTGQEEIIHEDDQAPSHKLTYFSVYDEKGHLCPLDNGLVENNIVLHVSGYIKPIYDEDPTPRNGIAAHNIGPINEWFIAGFDGGEKAVIGIVTTYAEYVLVQPAQEYEIFFQELARKIFLVKLVIEFLLDYGYKEPSFEDLLGHIQNEGIGEDFLLQHAQFVCDHIYSYEQAGDDDDKSLIVVPCVRTLVHLAGVKFRGKRNLKLASKSPAEGKTRRNFTKATTTHLVRSIFENFFPDQIQDSNTNMGPKKKRCGVCEACQVPDCGKCSTCKDMMKFGGGGKRKQACKQRRCPNMAVEDAEISENEEEDEDDFHQEVFHKKKPIFCKRSDIHKGVELMGEPVMESKGRKYYKLAKISDFQVEIGDCVLLTPDSADSPLDVGKIQYLYHGCSQRPMAHIQMFCRGSETILGETADPQELFVLQNCEDCSLGSVVKAVQVLFKETPSDWFSLGGLENVSFNRFEDCAGPTFYYSKEYDSKSARFTDHLVLQDARKGYANYCEFCDRRNLAMKHETPRLDLDNKKVEWLDEDYLIGSCVFLEPEVYDFGMANAGSFSDRIAQEVDESVYTEHYRKTEDVKGSNMDTPQPFLVAQILDIFDKSNKIEIQVRVFYRPDNTTCGLFLAYEKDENLLYWTDEVISCGFDKVRGKCFVSYLDTMDNPSEWSEKGPYRFYFSEAYNIKSLEFEEVPDFGRKLGHPGKGKKKKSAQNKSIDPEEELVPEWLSIERPLRCMDVFAGCGGLSLGLHQSGIANTEWAIEADSAAASAFKLNNENCQVFTEDCNEILRLILCGEGTARGLPTKGEVELLVGGPPCQGFSGMNRFNAGQYSLFKNSLVATYLSFCEYYRPKYFVLENVRNFVSFKRSMVLKLTLRCLLDMGYQVTFGVLQAGHYGVPQTRRRLILIAAAPGHVLPKFPEPQHVFNRRGCHLSVALDQQRYNNGCRWTDSAPYRTICVRDAISDLPDIQNGHEMAEAVYDGDAISHFQRKMRRKNDSSGMVVDHVCKQMTPLVEARIAHIPTTPGSDWRDLPNIAMKLSDGTTVDALKYLYRTKRQNKNEPNRGVCRCAQWGPCDPSDRQSNTIIPWCLPHTGDRHYHWAGLYGRLEWDGFFGTTVTNPEPMGKQGRVLHPEQNRVVSVRECARSQGFPDHFKFYGNIMEKHRQVGNAVPPPMGAAIGMEIRKAIALKVNK